MPGTTGTRRSARPCPSRCVQQIGPIHEVVALLGWPVLEVPGIEADDAIGTLARVAEAEGHRVLISTGDKDLAQLVSAQVTLINTMSNERLDVDGVQAKFGVPPQRIVDYLTLVGRQRGQRAGRRQGRTQDGSQVAGRVRLAGRRGGRRRAIKGAVGENLRKALDWLPTARRLVTVVTDCDLAAQCRAGRAWRHWRCATSTARRCWPSTSAMASAAGARNCRTRWALRRHRPAPRSRCPRRGRRLRRHRRRRRASTRWCSGSTACRTGWSACAPRHWPPSTPRPTRWTRCGPASSGCRSRSSPVARPTCHWRTTIPTRLRSCRWPRCWSACAPGWRMPGRPSWGRTSSTTCMCSPTTASPCAATGTTPCSRATSSRRTCATAWRRWPIATSTGRD
jgi:hypothetical protein